MKRFAFEENVTFDTDSGGAPGGSASAPEQVPAGSAAQDSGQAGGSTPNPFDQLVQLMNEPVAPASGAQPKTPASEQVLHSGSVPQPGQTPGQEQRPLQRVDLNQKPESTPKATPAAQAPDPRDAALQEMRSELARLQGFVQAQSQRQAQPEAAQPQQTPQRRYNFSAPPQVMEALRSEDPGVASQTFYTLLSDVAETVHRSVLQEVQQQLAPHIVQAATQQAGQLSQQQRVETDFYGTHRDLDQEHVRPIVRSVATRYLQELGPSFKSYSPEFRDEVARRTRSLIAMTAGVAQNFRPGPDQVAGRGGPAQLSPQGTRPNSGVQPNGAGLDHNSPQAIVSALFG